MKTWRPTAKMVALRDAARDAEYGGTIRSWCEAAGVVRERYYEYFDSPNFVEWWQHHVDAYFTQQMANLVGRMLTGEITPQAVKLVMERYDRAYCPRTRTDLEVSPIEVALKADETFDDNAQRTKA